MFTDTESVKFLQDDTIKQKFAQAKKLSDVKVSDYAAIFYVGGHGPVLDLATDPVNIKLASEVGEQSVLACWSMLIASDQFYRAGKITSAVCHGPA